MDNDNRNGIGSPFISSEPAYDNDYYPREEEQTEAERAYDEAILRRMRERRIRREKRRVRRNRTVALIILIVLIMLIVKGCSVVKRHKLEKAHTQASAKAEEKEKKQSEQQKAPVSESSTAQDSADSTSGDGTEQGDRPKVQQIDGITSVNGIIIVNKTYSLPEDYDPGVSVLAQNAFDNMAADAMNDGVFLTVNSGYRSYQEQESLYYGYALERGVAEADRVSSRPGHSEHQSGLCFDVNSTELSFAAHCADYGFIIRFPKGKEKLTGYEYEAWHIRYVGIDIAREITSKGICLEEYLGVTSDYMDAPDAMTQEQYAAKLGVTVDPPAENNGGGEQWQDNGGWDQDNGDNGYYDGGYYDYGYDNGGNGYYDDGGYYDYGYDNGYGNGYTY